MGLGIFLFGNLYSSNSVLIRMEFVEVLQLGIMVCIQGCLLHARLGLSIKKYSFQGVGLDRLYHLGRTAGLLL